jgi:DNA polymerase-4
MKRSIVHINVIGFRAAVAAAKDKTLLKRPYVIAGAAGGRSLVWDVSPEAKKAAVTPGMPLAFAEKRVKGLLVLAPDPLDIGNRKGDRLSGRIVKVGIGLHTCTGGVWWQR